MAPPRDNAGLPAGPSALVIGHPGHELRVHGWIERARPLVFVLTDGSGHAERSRLDSTTRILERTGARSGSVYGRFTDIAIYTALLDGDFSLFIDIARELTGAFLDERIAYIVADAAEGYNPSHDVCRYLADAAAEAAGIPCFAFDLVARPDPAPGSEPGDTAIVELDDEALERKLDAARGFAEMAAEVDEALNTWGAGAFRYETFRAVHQQDRWHEPAHMPPFYERHGERRVSEGAYDRAIRYAEHVHPLRNALLRSATGRTA